MHRSANLPSPVAEPRWTAPLRILTLWTLAVAQPIYDILGQGPTFFVYRRWETLDFVVFIAVVSLVLPLVALVLPAEAAGVSGRRTRQLAYLLATWGLLGLLLVAPLARLAGLGSLHGAWVVALAALLAAALARALARYRALRSVVAVLAAAIAVAPAVFLLRPEIRPLWRAQNIAPGAGEATASTVVVVVLDALPVSSLLDDALAVNPARYPSFARLAAQSTFYRNTRAAAPNTDQAVPAILSGRCAPARNIPPTAAQYPDNLFTWLGGAYGLQVLEPLTDLCPDALCSEPRTGFRLRFLPLLGDTAVVYAHWITPRPWSDSLPELEGRWGGFLGDRSGPTEGPATKVGKVKKPRQVELFRQGLRAISDGQEPMLFFSHLLLPHEPFTYLPSGREYRRGLREPGGNTVIFSEDPWPAHHSYQRHLLQVGFTDRLLGELWDRLDATDRWEEALIVVTADHGSSYRPGQPRRRLLQTNAVDILSVPLFLKRPGQQDAEVVDAPTHAVDTLALMAEALGRKPPAGLQGRTREQIESEAGAPLPCSRTAHGALDVPEGALRRSVERKIGLFGTGEDGRAWPAVGPRPDLVGLPLQAACPTPAPFEAGLDEPALLDSVEPDSGFLPAEMVGTVRGIDPANPLDLAVAINGHVQGTTRTYLEGTADAARFAVIVPQAGFRPGTNRVDLLAATEPGSSCPFSPIPPLGGAVSLLDARLGISGAPGVHFHKFFRVDQHRGEPARWTRPGAELRLSLTASQAIRVRQIRLDIRAVRPRSSRVLLLAGEEVLFEGIPPEMPWTTAFDVDGVTVPLVLGFEVLATEKRAGVQPGLVLGGLELSTAR